MSTSITRASILALACGSLLIGCVTRTRPELPAGGILPVQKKLLGEEIAHRAISWLGHPYRYGGADPSGFDCSGLVRYVFGQAGVEVPRTVSEQYRTARPVSIAELVPGDLLFFKIKSSHVSHVAIYIGQGQFVHAPRSGRDVKMGTLDDAFYRERMVGAGRFQIE